MIVLMDLTILDEAMADMDDDEQGYMGSEKLKMNSEEFRVMYSITDEDEMEELYDRVFAIVAGDAELVRYVEAIRICNDLNDVCEVLGVDKKTVYNLNKRLGR